MDEQPNLLLIVKVPRGLSILDTPRSQSMGARVMRVVPVGAQLYSYDVHNIGGVDYARLVPQNPVRPEWVRVAEADHSVEYVDVIKLSAQDPTSALADAITLLATAVRQLANK